MTEIKAPLPPFDLKSAGEKARMAENAWNSKNPEKVSLAYTKDSFWRNRDQFINGREEIVSFLSDKWSNELSYRLIKGVWAFTDNQIAARFAYEWHDHTGQWWRSYGNENWFFNENGLMAKRYASINDAKINESERKLIWEGDIRPLDYPGIDELGL